MGAAPAAGLGEPPGDRPTGVLIIRAWTEGPPEAPTVRARLSGRLDVEDEATETMAANSIDDVVDQTRAWLDAFAGVGTKPG